MRGQGQTRHPAARCCGRRRPRPRRRRGHVWKRIRPPFQREPSRCPAQPPAPWATPERGAARWCRADRSRDRSRCHWAPVRLGPARPRRQAPARRPGAANARSRRSWHRGCRRRWDRSRRRPLPPHPRPPNYGQLRPSYPPRTPQSHGPVNPNNSTPARTLPREFATFAYASRPPPTTTPVPTRSCGQIAPACPLSPWEQAMDCRFARGRPKQTCGAARTGEAEPPHKAGRGAIEPWRVGRRSGRRVPVSISAWRSRRNLANRR